MNLDKVTQNQFKSGISKEFVAFVKKKQKSKKSV